MDSARVVHLIETDILRRGEGTEADPIRIIRQWWTFDGELVVEHDDWAWKRAARERSENQHFCNRCKHPVVGATCYDGLCLCTDHKQP